ncbi:MAG TPA: hypothetical protein DCS66_04065, partial [Flavobacteriaceae bacterium]|nr:hypothetical protein [Flavobacteriaceae bacterium]
KYLLKADNWMMSYDNEPQDKQIILQQGLILVEKSRNMSLEDLNNVFKAFTGMSMITYNCLDPASTLHGKDRDLFLNERGRKIASIVCKKAKIKNYKILRFYWNFYRPLDVTDWHLDRSVSGCMSFVYNLHDSDGGTQIGKKVYKDIESAAKLFPSDTSHRGLGPKKLSFRLNLNCIFQLT